MKNTIVLFLGIILLWGCSSSSTENYLAKEEQQHKELFNEKYEQIKKEVNSDFQSFYSHIEKFQNLAVSFSSDSDFIAVPEEDVLDFSSENLLLITADDITPAGDLVPIFVHESSILKLKKAFEQPADSFMSGSYYNSDYRIDELNKAAEGTKKYMHNYRYIMVLKTTEHILPDVLDKHTFETGGYKGKLMLFNADNEQLLAVLDITAANNKSMYINTRDKQDAINRDYIKQINSAVSDQIRNTLKPQNFTGALMKLTYK